MKKKLVLWGLLITFIGCDSCPKDPHCPPPYDILSFELLSPEGNDLLRGAYKKYDIADIQVFAQDAQQKRIDANLSVVDRNVPNTIVYAYLLPNMERVFLELQNTVTDTLGLKYGTMVHQCCGRINTIHQIILNGHVVAEGNTTIQIIEK